MTNAPKTRIFGAEDARRLARRRIPKMAFDFVEGSSGREIAAPRNETAFDRIGLRQRVMADVATRSLTTRFLGRDYAVPFGIAPMGMCNLVRHGADEILGTLARARNMPYCLSTSASSTIEEMAGWGGANAWFQLYVIGDVEQAITLAERAKAAGYETLVLTVDVPQVSLRVRDLRNGLVMPFRMRPSHLIDFMRHPGWSLPMLMNGAPRPRNFPEDGSFDRGASRAGADWGFLDRVRALWPGKLIIKGVMDPEDAVRIRDAGADAIWVSNHGGRQLDSAPPSVTALPKVRAAVGAETPLILDSGVRSGEDVVKALALGADLVMMGRPWLYAIGAEGASGAEAFFNVIAKEMDSVLAQIGVKDARALSPDVIAALS